MGASNTFAGECQNAGGEEAWLDDDCCDARNNILIDFVGKYENIANDISYIENKINISLSLPHLNKSNLNSVKMDDKVKSRIFDIYKRDFKIFNYH